MGPVYGMSGTTLDKGKHAHIFLSCTRIACVYLVDLDFFYRMSTEMVACFTVEAISILEKIHAKGYALL